MVKNTVLKLAGVQLGRMKILVENGPDVREGVVGREMGEPKGGRHLAGQGRAGSWPGVVSQLPPSLQGWGGIPSTGSILRELGFVWAHISALGQLAPGQASSAEGLVEEKLLIQRVEGGAGGWGQTVPGPAP